MYVVAVYDVEAERTGKFLRLLRRYLKHVQNSVFEGEITRGDLEELEGKLQDRLQEGESVIVYELGSESLLNRTVFGDDPAEDERFL